MKPKDENGNNPNSFSGRENNSDSSQKGKRNVSAGTAPVSSSGSGDNRQAKISLPVGGGAIRGIGEKFRANPVTGTASFSVPLTISEGRDQFTPQLALSYDSGSGNSAFGLGWNIGLPSVSRKTDKGLPQYNDHRNLESDTFILSGAEDLVPISDAAGNQTVRSEDGYAIYSYRPRIEGMFSLIERWENQTTLVSHWRSVSKDNITSVYGYTEAGRIADPGNARKVFTWLIEESWDAKGNLMRFAYKPEDGNNVPASCYESPRLHRGDFANTYLKSISYGNAGMCAPSGCQSNYTGTFYFQLVFDYGDHSLQNPQPQPDILWPARQDPFSAYRAGFEIRTYRLCNRVLMFHRFSGSGSQPVPVRSTCLDYVRTSSFSLLQSVTHKAFENGNEASFPSLTFSYTEAVPAETFKTVPEESLSQLPAGVDGQNYQWADLYSEGVNGILTMNDRAWYFKPNYGDRQFTQPQMQSAPLLGAMKSEVPKPAAVRQGKASFRLNDVDGDGFPELVVQGEGINGFYSRNEEGEWQNFRNFAEYPNLNFNDANLRFMDLSGNGLADIVISKGETFDVYFSRGKKGFGNYRRVHCGKDSAPEILFSDPQQRIFLADMSGDGLTDIVKITNQGIVYWPNRGYGKFGEKVVMGNPPLLDSSDRFDARYLYLADVDGTGTADLLYISTGKIRYFKNLSGNAWEEQSMPDVLSAGITRQTFVRTVDLLGNGTQCIVVSSALPAQNKTMRYWELTSGKKPFLLKEIHNNMGAVTRLYYAPSTKFYMQDKLKGTPWITKLPFPVQVLEKVKVTDLVSEKCFTNRYAYHHGYYDPAEREFRGFGMVEQWDTEEYEVPVAGSATEMVPPVYTKTWFHTGFYGRRKKISRQYESEYFQGDAQAWQLPDTELPAGLSGEEAREACRALKGSALRVEVYAQDGSELETLPYTVEEKSYQLQCLQHRIGEHAGSPRYAVFLKTESETLTYHYERRIDDPRILHKLVLETDEYGNEKKSVQIAYPRRNGSIDEQIQFLMTYRENGFINDTQNDYRWIGVPYLSKQYQVHGFTLPAGKLTKADCSGIPGAVQIDYADTPSGALEKRPVQYDRTFFWNAGLTASLPAGEIAAHGLAYRQENLELTPSLVNQLNAEVTKVTDSLLENECRYLHEGNDWFAVGEITSYSATRFYLPVKMEDAFGNETYMDYDGYELFPVKITDALGFETIVDYDYRVLQPKSLTDPNGNSKAVAFDTLGMVTAMAVIGKNGEGDTLSAPTESYEYDLQCWQVDEIPVYAHIRKREKHADPATRWLESYVYTDGLGNEIMTKSSAEDGLAWAIQGGQPVEVETDHRWLASGKTILNNKGKAVKQYEPWYSVYSGYEFDDRLSMYGVTPVMHYDPLTRLIKTDFPDGTTAKVEFDVWRQKNYDQDDCDPASPHYNTPQIIDIDVLGRAFETTDDNGTYGTVVTRNKLDITGRILQVTDALNRVATLNRFAIGEKHRVYVDNIDSGKRWMIADTAEKQRYLWDSRDHRIKTLYDALLRPVQTLLKTGSSTEIVTQIIVYGTSAAENNIGQVIEIKAQDGKTDFEYDFKGNVLIQTKQFAQDCQNSLDWNTQVVLLNEVFATETTYDALNRPVTVTQPDSSIITYHYDKGGLLKQVLHNSTQHITNITYNPRGQRENIYYGNNTKTRYYYHPLNFRLTRILTTRNNGQDILQDLNYSYDSVGNITSQTDNAQQTFYFNNRVIAPTGSYQYDALYRLLHATGREQTTLAIPTDSDFVNNIPCPDMATNAMRNYTQHYQYDALGNMLQMSSQGQWARDYIYATATNRLLKHDSQQTFDDYTYDAHGNMLTMPHLSSMSYDYQDQLIRAGNGTFTSYYNYDAAGNRTRKVINKGNIREERYYVNGYEIYRKYINGTLDIERKTVTISDDEKVFIRIEQKTGETEVIRYQYDNHLGSACLELDDGGQIISYEEYHPFGTTSYRSGRTETEVSLKCYKYCGKERDEETGLYYYGMRYYAAWLCRFVSVDPLQFKYPYYTPYQYAGNKPISYIDLDGGEEKKPKLSEERISYYNKIGTFAILTRNRLDAMQNANKFKGLYLIAQARMENQFNLNPPGNNPLNIKGKGDLNTVTYMTKEYIDGEAKKMKQSFANFSTIEKGFEGYVNLLKNNYNEAYKTLFDDNKTITDFAKGLQTKGKLGVFATDPNYEDKMRAMLKGLVRDYEKLLDIESYDNNRQIKFLNKKYEGIDNPISDKAIEIQKRINKLENDQIRISEDKKLLKEFKKDEGL